MGVLPAGPGRDRDRGPVAHAAAPAPEGALSSSGDDPADLRDLLAQVGVDTVRAGLVVGSGGNLSAREPGGDTCWVTAAGSWLDRLDRDDFVRVRIADGEPAADPVPGRPICARRPADRARPASRGPTSEVALHVHTYRARPDVHAVVHLHPQSVVLLDALDERIRLVTTDHAYYVREVARVGFHPPGSTALAAAAAAVVAEGPNCVVLAHHGCSVLGGTVALAHKRARNLEEAARLTYRALLLGRRAVPECPRGFLADIDPAAPGAI